MGPQSRGLVLTSMKVMNLVIRHPLCAWHGMPGGPIIKMAMLSLAVWLHRNKWPAQGRTDGSTIHAPCQLAPCPIPPPPHQLVIQVDINLIRLPADSVIGLCVDGQGLVDRPRARKSLKCCAAARRTGPRRWVKMHVCASSGHSVWGPDHWVNWYPGILTVLLSRFKHQAHSDDRQPGLAMIAHR